MAHALAGNMSSIKVKYLKKPFEEGTDALTRAIANAYVDFTNWMRGSVTVIPQGAIFLSDRKVMVPVAQLVVRMVPNTDIAQFSYMGQNYLIKGPSDSNGNWAAVKA